MEKTKQKTGTVILFVLFAIYLIVLLKITIFRHPDMISNLLNNELYGVRSLNLIPFATVAEYALFISNGNIFIGLSNIFGNLIIFLPLGYMTALLFPKMRKAARILLLAMALSVVIEGSQYIFASGQTDIDDVILNTLGGMVGYWIYLLTAKVLKPRKYALAISGLMIACTCMGLFVGTNYQHLFQCDVKEINEDHIIVSQVNSYPAKEENTITTTDEEFEIIFSENCKIALIETQANGKVISEKAIDQHEIQLHDSMLINQFLIGENGVYMVTDIEIHRVK